MLVSAGSAVRVHSHPADRVDLRRATLRLHDGE